MKTTIRTYHPVPSLQRTNGNMQDAPRIKLILKTSVLEDEAKNPPATVPEVLAQCVREYMRYAGRRATNNVILFAENGTTSFDECDQPCICSVASLSGMFS